MNPQVTEHEAGPKRTYASLHTADQSTNPPGYARKRTTPFSDPAFAAEQGRRGAAERERRRMERIDSGREHQEIAYPDVCLRAAKLATGKDKAVTPLEWAAMKDLMDRVAGQATQKIETLRQDAIAEAVKRLTNGNSG